MALLRERFDNSQTNTTSTCEKAAKFNTKLNSQDSISKIKSFYNAIRVDSLLDHNDTSNSGLITRFGQFNCDQEIKPRFFEHYKIYGMH